MNTSTIRTRYARALVKYVQETGHGAIVCSQAERLEHALAEVPDLARMTAAQDVVSDHEKKTLLRTALGEPMADELERFIELLLRNGRIGLARFIFRDFVDMYRRTIGIRRAHLSMATEPSDAFLQRIRALLKSRLGDDIILDVDIEPDLISGFVFDLDGYMLDSSVARQLEQIRLQFIERNRRIV